MAAAKKRLKSEVVEDQTGSTAKAALAGLAARLDESMPVGNEGAGVVIKAGSSAAAQAEADAAAAAALAAPQSAAEMVQQATDEVQAMQV